MTVNKKLFNISWLMLVLWMGLAGLGVDAQTTLQSVYPAGAGIRVKEVDGSPNVVGVQTLVFPNGTLTRSGRTVTVTLSGGGATINSTDGALPYRLNGTTFGNSGISSNARSTTYLNVTSAASGSGITLAAEGGTNEGLTLASKAAASITLQTNGSSRWSVNSSGHFLAATDNAYDIGASGTGRPKSVYVVSNITYGGNLVGGNVYAGTSNYVGVGGRSLFSSPSDGVMKLTNFADTDFDRLQFGCTTASCPALKRSGAGLVVKVADDTAFSYLEVGGTNQGIYLRSSGANVKAPNNGQYIWVNGTDGGIGITDTGLARAAAKVISLTDSSTAGGALRAVPDSPSQITADQNNYQAGSGRSLFYRLSSDASRTITGLNPAGGTNQDGELHYIINVGSNNIVLANESASSTAANRFTTNTGSDITLAANEMAMIVYDNTSARWRAVKL